MNKKLPRLFQPNMRLYFLVLFAFAVATFFIGNNGRILSAIEVCILICLLIYMRVTSKRRTDKLLDYLESMSEGLDTTIRDTPLPVAIYNSDNGEIVWTNDRFTAITEMREALFELRMTDIVPGYSGDWLLDGKPECPDLVDIGDKKFRVHGSMVLSEREYIAMTYWVDVTEFSKISDEYHASRPVYAILLLDNYDDLLKGASEKEKSSMLSAIDDEISSWVALSSGGYLCRPDRDKYLFLFEERDYAGYAELNFSLLDAIRDNISFGTIHATMSIGVGKDGATPYDCYRQANLAIEMALSRGGDQAVVRNKYGFDYFGGRAQSAETHSFVKARVLASAFGELLNNTSIVYIMGHKFSDYDSFGAAAGICCIARTRNIPARIVINPDNNLAQNIIEIFRGLPEYAGMLITEHEAIIEADPKSLLVVTDTNRPDKVESETMLLSCTHVAVIDHHRRAADYIENAVFTCHDPAASSTSELVTEMLQHLVEKSDILRPEAEALLAGIVLDTKSFSINTGSRTFDAAAYLQRMGAVMSTVKMLLQTNIETTIARYKIMSGASIYKEGVALATSDIAQGRLSVPQAADELLNIEGVHTSFVAALVGDEIYVSGRSIGGMNVQLILEKLGGGGSPSIAGAQIHNSNVDKVMQDLKVAIDEYSDAGKKKSQKQ